MFSKILKPKFLFASLGCASLTYYFNKNKNVKCLDENTTKESKTMVLYEQFDEGKIDEQVKQILRQFSRNYRDVMSQQFQLGILPKQSSVDQPLIIIFDEKQKMNFIKLNKYIGTGQYTNLFEKLNKHVNKCLQVNMKNVMEIINKGIYRDTCHIIVNAQSNSIEDLKKAKKVLRQFYDNLDCVEDEVQSYIIHDDNSKTILGVNKLSPNRVYLIAPKNKNMINKQNYQYFKIFDKQYTIVDIAAKPIQEQFVFPPYFSKLHSNCFILKIKLNKNDSNYYQNNDKIYQELRSSPYLIKRLQYGDNTAIILEKNNFDQLVNMYEPNTKYSHDQKLEALSNSHEWKYTGPFLSKEIIAWIDRVKQGKQQQYFKSEVPEQKTYNSKRIVGEQYMNVINQPVDKMIFHYSHHCHSCKRFGGIYEQIALQSQKWKKPIKFYRIDNDFNKANGLKNYNYTPVFVMYRKGQKIPLIFKHNFFTKEIFLSFININREISFINSENFEALISKRQNVMEEFL